MPYNVQQNVSMSSSQCCKSQARAWSCRDKHFPSQSDISSHRWLKLVLGAAPWKMLLPLWGYQHLSACRAAETEIASCLPVLPYTFIIRMCCHCCCLAEEELGTAATGGCWWEGEGCCWLASHIWSARLTLQMSLEKV